MSNIEYTNADILILNIYSKHKVCYRFSAKCSETQAWSNIADFQSLNL
jgi:hypothetical protein